MTSDALFVGIDGGGTRCRARIRDSTGALLGEGEAGPANARRGATEAMAAVTAACRAALAAAGLERAALARLDAGVGLAGVSQKREMAATLALPHPFRRMTLTTDSAIACLGAHGGADGGIVIVGTGSAAFGRVDGRELRFGGWGFEVSDDGGGAPLGRSALRHALRAADGLEPRGSLADAMLAAVGGDQDAAVDWVGRAAPSDFGGLAPLVFAHAGVDPAAAMLADETARHIGALVMRLVSGGCVRVALVGGMSDVVAARLTGEPRRWLSAAKADPADGAILLARQAAS